MKKFRYRLEHVFLLVLHAICKILPWEWGSALFGFIAGFLGPRMAMNRKAVRHIRAALECDENTARDIAKGHWNNLGRVIAEYPQLKTIATHHVRFKGLDILQSLKDDGKPAVLFGAHLGNWEVLPYALLHHVGLEMHPVYRAPNNPYVDQRLHAYRSPEGRLIPYPKSRKGMVAMVKALKDNQHLGLLIDQKYNEGIDADFFGMNAKTGTAFIELAQKYKCPLVPLRCVREKNGFLVEALPPISTLNREVTNILEDTHALLEKWIREHPDQWLWLHRRWKAEELKHGKT